MISFCKLATKICFTFALEEWQASVESVWKGVAVKIVKGGRALT